MVHISIDTQDDTQPWSIPWSVLEVEEFLFATGDQEKWIIVNKVDLIGADGTKEYTAEKYLSKPAHLTVNLTKVTP